MAAGPLAVGTPVPGGMEAMQLGSMASAVREGPEGALPVRLSVVAVQVGMAAWAVRSAKMGQTEMTVHLGAK